MNTTDQPKTTAISLEIKPTEPKRFRALCVAQILAVLAGSVLILVNFGNAFSSLAAERTSDNVMGFFWLIITFVIVAVWALQALAAYKTLKRRASFWFWTLTYAVSSLVLRVPVYALYAWMIYQSSRLAMTEAAEQNPLAMALAGVTVSNEMESFRTQKLVVFFLILLFTAAYPATTLVTTLTKKMKNYSKSLSTI